MVWQSKVWCSVLHPQKLHFCWPQRRQSGRPAKSVLSSPLQHIHCKKTQNGPRPQRPLSLWCRTQTFQQQSNKCFSLAVSHIFVASDFKENSVRSSFSCERACHKELLHSSDTERELMANWVIFQRDQHFDNFHSSDPRNRHVVRIARDLFAEIWSCSDKDWYFMKQDMKAYHQPEGHIIPENGHNKKAATILNQIGPLESNLPPSATVRVCLDNCDNRAFLWDLDWHVKILSRESWKTSFSFIRSTKKKKERDFRTSKLASDLAVLRSMCQLLRLSQSVTVPQKRVWTEALKCSSYPRYIYVILIV